MEQSAESAEPPRSTMRARRWVTRIWRSWGPRCERDSSRLSATFWKWHMDAINNGYGSKGKITTPRDHRLWDHVFLLFSNYCFCLPFLDPPSHMDAINAYVGRNPQPGERPKPLRLTGGRQPRHLRLWPTPIQCYEEIWVPIWRLGSKRKALANHRYSTGDWWCLGFQCCPFPKPGHLDTPILWLPLGFHQIFTTLPTWCFWWPHWRWGKAARSYSPANPTWRQPSVCGNPSWTPHTSLGRYGGLGGGEEAEFWCLWWWWRPS